MIVNFSLPIYYTQVYAKPKTTTRKLKSGKIKTTIKTEHTFMVAMNWYRNVNPFTEHKVKEHYHKIILKHLEALKGKKSTRYTIRYKLFHKSKICDAMNVISIIDKYLCDALQEGEIVVDDNVQHYKYGSWIVGGLDKLNPRMEIELELM